MFKFSPYLESLRQMETQFEFLRYAFNKLSKNRAEEFFAAKRKTELSEGEIKLDKILQDTGDAEIVEQAKQHNKRKLLKKWGTEKRELYREQYVPDDLNKSELLLLVALFEGYLKEFYEALVRVEPRRAFAKSGKQESLREIFADNVLEWNKGKFFQKVVQDEVDRFDHTPFEERITFLAAAYKLKIEGDDLKRANELIARRHKISHRWTDRNEVKHVSPQELHDARRVFQSISESLFRQAQASEEYSKHFAY